MLCDKPPAAILIVVAPWDIRRNGQSAIDFSAILSYRYRVDTLMMISISGSRQAFLRRCMSTSIPEEALSFQEPIHILGGGSIGLLWAASIRSVFPSYPVQVLLRGHHQHRLKEGNSKQSGSIAVCLHDETSTSATDSKPRRQPYRSRVLQIPAAILSRKTGSMTPFRNLVIATKAPSALNALESVVHRIDPNVTRVILLCNGALAVRDELASVTKGCSVKLALTSHGAYREQEQGDEDDEIYHLIHAGRGKTLLQEYPDMARLWDLAGLTCQSITTKDIEKRLWHKLAANCVINPLTALYNCRNGELRNMPELQETISGIIYEVAELAQHELGDITELSVDNLTATVASVMTDTAQNKSSMLQDVLALQPTEIGYLNGFVVNRRHTFGLESKTNQLLVGRILDLAQSIARQDNEPPKMTTLLS